MKNESTLSDPRIDAGWKYAEAYDGDDRQDIKSDVFNAFQAGIEWNLRAALQVSPVVPPERTSVEDLERMGAAMREVKELGEELQKARIKFHPVSLASGPSSAEASKPLGMNAPRPPYFTRDIGGNYHEADPQP